MKDVKLALTFALTRKYMLTQRGRHTNYICSALLHLRTTKQISEVMHIDAHVLIHKRLGHVASYEAWLDAYHNSTFARYRNQHGYDAAVAKAREGRLAWLDSLIKEFS